MSELISITGNVANAPVVKYTATGRAVTNFAVYENTFAKGESGKIERQAKRTRVTAWEDLAQACSECLTKGCRVTVKGVLRPYKPYVDSKGVTHEGEELVLRAIDQT
jgi:single-stranded DNA-binding protein